jgi:HSP20 family molecular chaperone IbpA
MPVTGFDKSALEASLKGNVLTITGTPAKTEMKIVRKGFMPAAFTTYFTLIKNADSFFSAEAGLAYPIFQGIPMLTTDNAIVASSYLKK